MSKFTDVLDNLLISDYNNKRISISTLDGKPLRLQIPRMYMPFGLSGFTPEIGPTKWNIDFSMKGHDEEGNTVKLFHEFLKTIEGKIIESIKSQSELIFNAPMTDEELLPMFNSNIKETPEREPKFRVKVDTTMDEKVKPYIYDAEKNQLHNAPVNGLYSRNSGVAIVELNSVYFLNKKFGITWKLYQLVVHEPQRLKGFQFQ